MRALLYFFPAILSGLFALKIIVSNYLFPRISVCPRKREKVNICHLFFFCQGDMGSLQPLDTNNNLLQGGEIIGAHCTACLENCGEYFYFVPLVSTCRQDDNFFSANTHLAPQSHRVINKLSWWRSYKLFSHK